MVWIACFFPAVMDNLNGGKAPVRVFADLLSGRRTVETWPIKGMPVQGMTQWVFERCLKVGHVDAHQNSPRFGRWLESTTGYTWVLPYDSQLVPWSSRHWGLEQCRDGADSSYVPFALSEAQNVSKNCSVSKERVQNGCDRFPGKKTLNIAGKSDWCW